MAITSLVGRVYKYSTSYDVVSDTYFWNNKENGIEITYEPAGGTDSLYITENANYFVKNPVGEIIKGSVYTPYTYPHPLRGGGNIKYCLILE
jgi:hypothetical protein